MKKFLTTGLSAIALSIFIFSCAGVGGETLSEEQKEIAVQSLLGSTGFSNTYVSSAVSLAGAKKTLVKETDISLDSNGSTLDYKASLTCGVVTTLSVLLEAHLVNLTSPVALQLDSGSAYTQCTAVVSGNFEMKVESKASVSGSGSVLFRAANSDADGLNLKVTRNDTGDVIFNQPVFLLFETKYAVSSQNTSADVLCKINGEKYESDWLYDWDYNF